MTKDNTPSGETVREVLSELFYTGSGQPTGDGLTVDDALPRLRQAIEGMVERVIGVPIELRADIDDKLKQYVPDIEERSVDGVSPSFTSLYTRAIVRSAQESQRQRAKEEISKLFGEQK